MSQEFFRFAKINQLETDLYGGGNSQKWRYFKVKKILVLIHFPRKKKWKTPGHATRQIYLPIDWNHHLDQIFSVEWDLTEICQVNGHQIMYKSVIALKRCFIYNGELNNNLDMNRKYFIKWPDNEFFLTLYINGTLQL